MDKIEKRWTDIAEKMLKGRTIVEVRYLSQKEADDLGWGSRCIVLQLDDGNVIYPSRDDEGNDAGALFTNNEEHGGIPVIR